MHIICVNSRVNAWLYICIPIFHSCIFLKKKCVPNKKNTCRIISGLFITGEFLWDGQRNKLSTLLKNDTGLRVNSSLDYTMILFLFFRVGCYEKIDWHNNLMKTIRIRWQIINLKDVNINNETWCVCDFDRI